MSDPAIPEGEERAERQMNETDVRRWVAEIAEAAKDADEHAHFEQDHLWLEVLRAIADGRIVGTQARASAVEAIKAADIKFHRWYA